MAGFEDHCRVLGEFASREIVGKELNRGKRSNTCLPMMGQVPGREIVSRIQVIRGQRVLLDSDLAELYGVTAKRLNEQVRRNQDRFPKDFVFVLPINELRPLRSQFATLDSGRGRHRKHPAFAYTEHGAIMAATVLNSPRAVEMSVYVVRAFVKLRKLLATNADLAGKLEALEKSVAGLDARTKQQFEEVYAAIRALMSPPIKPSRSIGFTANLD